METFLKLSDRNLKTFNLKKIKKQDDTFPVHFFWLSSSYVMVIILF